MSTKTDDKLIDADLTEPYLRGGSKYSTLYSEIESDDVPPALDSVVLAEAAAAVKTRKGFAWKRYTPMIAVAATAILTVSVVLRSGLHLANKSPEQSLTQEGSASEAPKLANRSTLEIAELPAAAEPPVEEKANEDRSKQERAPPAIAAHPMSPAAAPRPPKADVPTKKEADEVVVTGTFVRGTSEDVALPVDVITSEQLEDRGQSPIDLLKSKARGESALGGPRNTIPIERKAVDKRDREEERVAMAQSSQANTIAVGPRAVPAAAPSASRSDQATGSLRQLNPGSWLAYIRELRAAGKSVEADREWEKFVDAYPTYRVDEKDAARPKK